MFFLNVMALEISFFIFLYYWEKEAIDFLINLIFNIQVSWLIFITSILWIFHVGSKHYTIIYTKGGDNEIYEIEFPSINLR